MINISYSDLMTNAHYDDDDELTCEPEAGPGRAQHLTLGSEEAFNFLLNGANLWHTIIVFPCSGIRSLC